MLAYLLLLLDSKSATIMTVFKQVSQNLRHLPLVVTVWVKVDMSGWSESSNKQCFIALKVDIFIAFWGNQPYKSPFIVVSANETDRWQMCELFLDAKILSFLYKKKGLHLFGKHPALTRFVMPHVITALMYLLRYKWYSKIVTGWHISTTACYILAWLPALCLSALFTPVLRVECEEKRAVLLTHSWWAWAQLCVDEHWGDLLLSVAPPLSVENSSN